MTARTERPRSWLGKAAHLALVDGDKSMHTLLHAELESAEPEWRVEAYPNGESALAELPAAPPRLVLLEQTLPDGCGIECARRLRSRLPALPVLILAAEACLRRFWAALSVGATGYVLKTGEPRDLLPHLRRAMSGRIALCEDAERLLLKGFTGMGNASGRWGLSRREQDVMNGLCRQQTDKEISVVLGVSAGTIHTHLAAIYKKLAVHNREAAVQKFYHSALGGQDPGGSHAAGNLPSLYHPGDCAVHRPGSECDCKSVPTNRKGST